MPKQKPHKATILHVEDDPNEVFLLQRDFNVEQAIEVGLPHKLSIHLPGGPSWASVRAMIASRRGCKQ